MNELHSIGFIPIGPLYYNTYSLRFFLSPQIDGLVSWYLVLIIMMCLAVSSIWPWEEML